MLPLFEGCSTEHAAKRKRNQVVFHVAAALRAHPELGFLDEVLEFVGVNDSSAGGAGGGLGGGAGGGPAGAGERQRFSH